MKKLLLLFGGMLYCLCVCAQSSTTIKTPTNATISALLYSEFSSADSAFVANAAATWISNHGSNAVRVAPLTKTYNCHGYAWHVKDGGNRVWVNAHDQSDFDDDPEALSPYWSGGSPTYSSTSAGEATVAFYGSCWSFDGSNYRNNCDHSAKVLSTTLFESKWGAWPLYQHAPGDCPYNSSSIQYYKVLLTGSEILCSSQTYSTVNISGASYSWNASNVSFSGSGHSITASTSTNNSSVNLTVDIASPYSSTTVQAKKSIWLGYPSLTKRINGVIAGTTPVSPGTQYTLSATSLSPSTSFNYNDYAGYGNVSLTIYSPNSPTTNMYVSSSSTSGHRNVRVTATNTCGSNYEDFVFYVPNYRMMAYPNPTTEVVTVEFPDASLPETLPGRIDLYSEKEAKKVKTISVKEAYDKNLLKDGNKLELNVKDLPRGIYYIRVEGNRTETNSDDMIRILLN